MPRVRPSGGIIGPYVNLSTTQSGLQNIFTLQQARTTTGPLGTYAASILVVAGGGGGGGQHGGGGGAGGVINGSATLLAGTTYTVTVGGGGGQGTIGTNSSIS